MSYLPDASQKSPSDMAWDFQVSLWDLSAESNFKLRENIWHFLPGLLTCCRSSRDPATRSIPAEKTLLMFVSSLIFPSHLCSSVYFGYFGEYFMWKKKKTRLVPSLLVNNWASRGRPPRIPNRDTITCYRWTCLPADRIIGTTHQGRTMCQDCRMEAGKSWFEMILWLVMVVSEAIRAQIPFLSSIYRNSCDLSLLFFCFYCLKNIFLVNKSKSKHVMSLLSRAFSGVLLSSHLPFQSSAVGGSVTYTVHRMCRDTCQDRLRV